MSMVAPIPAGMDGLIPHLTCDQCAEAIEFYKKAFGAVEASRSAHPDGRKILHASLRIGKSYIFVNDDFPEYCGGKSQTPKALGATPVAIHQYVEDCDAAVKRAQDAGATVVLPPTDMFWGSRYAVLVDPFGHKWAIATHIADVSPDKMAEAAKAMFSKPK